MVFIYHRLNRPGITDFELIPNFFRQLIFKFKRYSFPVVNTKELVEAEKPLVITKKIPGPKGIGLLNDIEQVSNDYIDKSVFMNLSSPNTYKNYFADVDGNTILDLNNSGVPLGYNDKNLVNLSQTKQYESALSNHSNSLSIQDIDSLDLLNDIKKQIAPKDLTNFILTNEPLSMAVSLAYNQNNKRTVLHMNKHLKFPEIKKYKEEFSVENKQLIQEALDYNLALLKENCNGINSLVVSAVNYNESGHLWGKGEFFNQIRNLCKELNINFIVNETNTALVTGRVWRHEHWNLDVAPDFVLFGGAMQVSGIFANDKVNNCEYNSIQPSYEPHKLLNLQTVINTIGSDNLFNKSLESGKYLKNKILDISQYNSGLYSNPRGKGSLLSFDMENKDKRNNFVKFALNNGVYLKKLGSNSVGVRSSLRVEYNHYDHLVNVMNNYTNKH